ncbi:MAG: LPS assembly lipoprotein LptE [Shimia sp.]
MSWSRRGLLLGGVALAGCGFTPALVPGAGLRGTVRVDAPDTIEGFTLVRALERNLGRAEAPVLGLSVAVDVAEDGVAVNAAQDVQRFELIGTAAFRLRRLDDLAVVQSGEVRAFTGYSTTGTTVATRTAREDALARLMQILADRIVARLTLAQ